MSLPIRGGSLDLGLVYNAHDAVSVGLGGGWRLDAFRRLAVNPTSGAVTLTDGTGARHTFTRPSGWPESCCRCGGAMDRQRDHWMFTMTPVEEPVLVHLECPLPRLAENSCDYPSERPD